MLSPTHIFSADKSKMHSFSTSLLTSGRELLTFPSEHYTNDNQADD